MLFRCLLLSTSSYSMVFSSLTACLSDNILSLSPFSFCSSLSLSLSLICEQDASCNIYLCLNVDQRFRFQLQPKYNEASKAKLIE